MVGIFHGYVSHNQMVYRFSSLPMQVWKRISILKGEPSRRDLECLGFRE